MVFRDLGHGYQKGAEINSLINNIKKIEGHSTSVGRMSCRSMILLIFVMGELRLLVVTHLLTD